MIYGWNKNTSRRLHLMQSERISKREAREIVLDTYEPFKIFSRKKDGTRIIRNTYSVVGPKTTGNAPGARYRYWEAPWNYMILYDIDKSGFRTFLMEEIYKLEKDGVTYIVQ